MRKSVAATPESAVEPHHSHHKRGDTLSAAELADRAIQRRAIEVAIWGIPLVNYDAMYQAMVRDAKGGFNQIVFWSLPSDWMNQTLTPNGEVLYALIYANTRDAGPMVLEIPPAGDAELMGSIIDAWQVPVEDVGPAGADRGQGANYLLLPPGFKGDIPGGFVPLRLSTFQSYIPLRTIPKSGSGEDLAKSAAYLKHVRLYPFSRITRPPATRFIDMCGVVFDSTIPYGPQFFRSLNRMIQEEPLQTKDLVMTDYLKSIGIEKGKPFRPNPKVEAILSFAAHEAHSWFEARLLHALAAYYPNRQWTVAAESILPETQATFLTHDLYALDARGMTFYWVFGAMRHPGSGSFYLVTMRDHDQQLLRGEHRYRLQVPPNVPAKQFWSIAVYDLATGAFIREAARVSMSSFVEDLQKNADGSTTIYFGPRAPTGKHSNWIPTKAGGRFFLIFRFYGPQKSILDKSWILPDVTEAD